MRPAVLSHLLAPSGCATVDAASSSICWLAEQPCVPCMSAPLGQR